MIEIKEYASVIEKELNIIAEGTDLTFKIHAGKGNYKKAIKTPDGKLNRFVNGVLRLTTGDFTPVENIENVYTHCTLELAVAQEDCDDVYTIASIWAKSLIGVVHTIGETSYLMTPTLPEAGFMKNGSPIGSMIPLRISVGIQSIERGLLSNMVKWTINGTVVNVENASFVSQRTSSGITNPNKNFTITANAYCTDTINMLIPYSYTPVITQIKQNILGDKKSEVFAISRDDGENVHTGNYILTSGSIAEASEKIVSLTCTFMRTK